MTAGHIDDAGNRKDLHSLIVTIKLLDVLNIVDLSHSPTPVAIDHLALRIRIRTAVRLLL